MDIKDLGQEGVVYNAKDAEDVLRITPTGIVSAHYLSAVGNVDLKWEEISALHYVETKKPSFKYLVIRPHDLDGFLDQAATKKNKKAIRNSFNIIWKGGFALNLHELEHQNEKQLSENLAKHIARFSDHELVIVPAVPNVMEYKHILKKADGEIRSTSDLIEAASKPGMNPTFVYTLIGLFVALLFVAYMFLTAPS